MKKEDIFNVPNFLTLTRFILAFVLMVMFYFNVSVMVILYTFIFFLIGITLWNGMKNSAADACYLAVKPSAQCQRNLLLNKKILLVQAIS